MHKFLKNIFSISLTDDMLRYKIILFCIKISFPRPICLIRKLKNPYYYYKKNNLDITTLSPATGQLRMIQLANLEILKEMDYVCKQNNLTYWLDAGTLLGAIRHKGFIPWDDDIDTAMPREDYEKIIDAFKKSSRNPDIYAEIFYAPNDKTLNCHIKVQHKKCSHIFVDIFPWDSYGKRIEEDKQIRISTDIKNTRKFYVKNVDRSRSIKSIKKELNMIMKEKFLTNEVKNNNYDCDYVWGMDFSHQWNNWFTHYEVVYPLKTIEFEGIKFPCINNPDAFLKRVYGDYMSYPSKISIGHGAYLKLSKNELEIIKGLVNNL